MMVLEKKKKKPTHLTSVGFSLQLLHNIKAFFFELRRVSLILKILICGDSCVPESHLFQFITSPSSEVRKPETFCRRTKVSKLKMRNKCWQKQTEVDESMWFKSLSCFFPGWSRGSFSPYVRLGDHNVSSLGENPVSWFCRMIELKDLNSDMSSYVPGVCSVSVHYSRAAFCCPAQKHRKYKIQNMVLHKTF